MSLSNFSPASPGRLGVESAVEAGLAFQKKQGDRLSKTKDKGEEKMEGDWNSIL